LIAEAWRQASAITISSVYNPKYASNRELERTTARADPYGATLGAERAHTLVENRAIEFVRCYRGAGQLAEPGKNFFQTRIKVQFVKCV
jgi:hypothetical protein